MSQYLILLALVPIAVFQLTKIFNSEDKWLYRGLSVGLVIAPVSYGLLQFTYIPVMGKVLGLLGVAVNLTHGSVGYFALAGSGFFEPGILLSGSQLTMINLVNGVIFACCYGVIGYSIDRKLEAEKTAPLFS